MKKAKRVPLTPENAAFSSNLSDKDIDNMVTGIREQFIAEGLLPKPKAKTAASSTRWHTNQTIAAQG